MSEVNDGKEKNGGVKGLVTEDNYYYRTKYHAIFSLFLQVVRAFAFFYFFAAFLIDDTRVLIGTAMLCVGIAGLSTILIEKLRIPYDKNN